MTCFAGSVNIYLSQFFPTAAAGVALAVTELRQLSIERIILQTA